MWNCIYDSFELFPTSKIDFGHFWNCKRWILVKYFLSWNWFIWFREYFWSGLFFNFLADCAYSNYLHKWIICWCNEIFSFSRWHIQTGDSAMPAQNNISNFGSIDDFKIRNLSVSGQSQDLTLTGMISSPDQSRCGCQNKPSLKFFKTREKK